MDIGYGNDEVLETAQKNTEEALEEQYDGLGLDWTVIAKLVSGDGQAADKILDTADARDADHIFLSGKRRSPTGKAVFGDRAQAVILNFDGPVTTLTD